MGVYSKCAIGCRIFFTAIYAVNAIKLVLKEWDKHGDMAPCLLSREGQ